MLKNIILIESYRISFNTYLIMPIKNGEKLYCHVYDKNGEFIVERKPIYIVRKSCEILGYNYNHAKNFSKSFLGKAKHKLPIIITHDGIPNVFFPLFSPTSPNNIWVGLHAITNIRRHKEFTEITLIDGKEFVLPINYASFCSQYVCATMLQKHASQQRIIIRNELTQPPKPIHSQELTELFEKIDPIGPSDPDSFDRN
ncbi:competence protein ComK [Ureibacillus aquaedulcis]|uniref:Competence protein ComK n=1 Tax=Ureibacillus aquaedulcis TaxID=3058421 RepID=A0ABT8GLG7_9BACL|nr:competence protein ComK [Ureibacillus sp. BA0131]MDN4492252.1 competence protein ComK [Ureibacillus sp. BA0131]